VRSQADDMASFVHSARHRNEKNKEKRKTKTE